MAKLEFAKATEEIWKNISKKLDDLENQSNDVPQRIVGRSYRDFKFNNPTGYCKTGKIRNENLLDMYNKKNENLLDMAKNQKLVDTVKSQNRLEMENNQSLCDIDMAKNQNLLVMSMKKNPNPLSREMEKNQNLLDMDHMLNK